MRDETTDCAARCDCAVAWPPSRPAPLDRAAPCRDSSASRPGLCGDRGGGGGGGDDGGDDMVMLEANGTWCRSVVGGGARTCAIFGV